jgi:putative flippase GtrA
MKRGFSSSAPSALQRWLRFNFVGLIGVALQLVLLQTFLLTTSLDYKVATLLAVEITVLHNFVWHLQFTWRERRARAAKIVLRRLLTFHLTNGVVSLAGSWTLMTLLVGRARFPVLAANIVSIVACSVVNFLLSEVLVFQEERRKRRRRPRPLRFSNKCELPAL